MLLGAQYIKKRLDDVGILDRAFNLYPNYGLILTGTDIFLKHFYFSVINYSKLEAMFYLSLRIKEKLYLFSRS